MAAGQLVRDIPNLYACVCGPRGPDACLTWCKPPAPTKVIFGSDFGFSDWTILAEFLDNVREASIDPTSMDHILYTTRESYCNWTNVR